MRGRQAIERSRAREAATHKHQKHMLRQPFLYNDGRILQHEGGVCRFAASIRVEG